MKIAIIGTNGFLSTTIAKYGISKKWQIDMYGLKKPFHHEYSHFYKIDLIHEEIYFFQICKYDLIIYAAGAGIQSDLNENVDIIYQLNTFVPVRLCKELQNNNYMGVLVTFGSYFELGESYEHKLATELDIINANTPAPTDYILSKRMLTKFIISYKHTFTHWHFILPTIFGPGENPLRLIPYTIKSIQNNEKLNFTSGEQIRQYLHVENVIKSIEKAIEIFLPSGVYNIASEYILSVKELIEKISKIMQIELPLDTFGTKNRLDVTMKYLAIDGTKINQYLGKIDMMKLEEVLQLYLL